MEHAHKIRFFAPELILGAVEITRPEQAQISEIVISGAAIDQGKGYSPDDSLIEEFANCRIEIAAIERFIRRFGPLWTSTSDEGVDKTFRFSVHRWRALRQSFRLAWDGVLGLPSRDVDLARYPEELKKAFQQKHKPIRSLPAHGRFVLTTDTGLVFIAKSLYHALLLKLFSLAEAKRLRRCLRPDCPNRPYFIADHARQQYCSDMCAAWGQQQFKKAWWAKHGEEWRKAQLQTKKKQNGHRSSQKGRKSHGRKAR